MTPTVRLSLNYCRSAGQADRTPAASPRPAASKPSAPPDKAGTPAPRAARPDRVGRPAEACRPCVPPARRFSCPSARGGCRGCAASSSAHRSTAAWNLVELSKSSRRRRSAFCACNASLLARNPSFSARSVALSARWAARNASFARRSHATSPRNCQMSPMSAAIGSRIVAGVIPTLTHTSALRVSINHPPAQNSRRLLQIGLTQLGSYWAGEVTPKHPLLTSEGITLRRLPAFRPIPIRSRFDSSSF